jgi:hypothetical protein
MATNAQILANRENAKHSTGPTSTAGRAASSQNGLKHGLASSTLIIQGENAEAFDILLAGLLAEHKPQTLTETLLVQDMAKYHWLIDRALGLQSEVVETTLRIAGQIAPQLGLLIRYQTANERAFQKAYAMLNTLRKARQAELKAEIGSASQPASEPSPAPLPPAPFTLPPVEEILKMMGKGLFHNPVTNQYEPFEADEC